MQCNEDQIEKVDIFRMVEKLYKYLEVFKKI